MAALLRLAGVGAFENGDDDSDDEDGEAPPNALMKLTGKRPAERSPSVSPNKSVNNMDVAEDEEEKMPEIDFSDDEEEEEEKPARSRAGNKNASGSDESHWEARANKASVEAEILGGCKCGCVHKYGLSLLDEIIAEREWYAGMSQKERRAHSKSYFFEHKCSSRKCGFKMTWFDDDVEACLVGFSASSSPQSSCKVLLP